MPDLSLAVIIPSKLTSDQLPQLRRAITSLHQQTVAVQVVVYVVSVNLPPAAVRKQWPEVTFLQAAAESGFGELNNWAVEHLRHQPSKPHWLLLLNDDAWVEQTFVKTIKQLIKQHQAQPIDVYVPLTLEAENRNEIDSFGVEYFRSGYAKNCRRTDLATTLASAGCLLLRWSFVESFITHYTYFFNPLYFYYLEDVDLTLRMRMMGSRFVKSSQLRAYHTGSASSGGRRNTFAMYHTYRNVLWVIICCWPLIAIVRNSLSILLVQAWICGYGTVHCGVLTYPRILVETALKLPQLLSYRRKTVTAHDSWLSFQKLLAPYTFRTFHNRTIPAV